VSLKTLSKHGVIQIYHEAKRRDAVTIQLKYMTKNGF
jgi:hypothetical protein